MESRLSEKCKFYFRVLSESISHSEVLAFTSKLLLPPFERLDQCSTEYDKGMNFNAQSGFNLCSCA
jgi:hypothetical protein